MNTGIELAENGWLPDWLTRWGIRQQLQARLREEAQWDCAERQNRLNQLLDELRQGPIAVHVTDANVQHYEVPAAYFELVLGPHLKYSSGYWPQGITTLEASEAAMLQLTCERANLANGHEILELGCGWGSLSLWMAEKFPQARILSVSNSKTQREFILAQCRRRGLTNLEVETADMNEFQTARRFDRVVSVEMFEHMRNYELLLGRIATWLKSKGQLFVHIFTHRDTAYPFEIGGENDWMARHFFTGGMMPSDHLLSYFQSDLTLSRHWCINGRHYSRTLEAWLRRHDAEREQIKPLFADAYGPELGNIMFHRWRIFYLACSELFAFAGGDQWWVSHYLFSKRDMG